MRAGNSTDGGTDRKGAGVETCRAGRNAPVMDFSADCWLKAVEDAANRLDRAQSRQSLDWLTSQVGSGWRLIDWARGARFAAGAFLRRV